MASPGNQQCANNIGTLSFPGAANSYNASRNRLLHHVINAVISPIL